MAIFKISFFPKGHFFYVGSHFLRVWGLFLCMGGGGGGAFLGLPSLTIFFSVTSCCHNFYCTDIYNFSRS